MFLWTAALDSIARERLGNLQSLLSPDEKQRAFRFRFEIDRNRFITCRGILRELLGSCLGIEPPRICFTYGPHGKPQLNLPNEGKKGVLGFNLSHSASWAVYAVAFGNVGVDLEVIRPVPEMDALVECYFSASERNAFASFAPELRLKAFFNCWTRKEAYVKACGGGLSIPLDQFEVSLDPTSPARLIGAQGVSAHELEWDLHNLDLSADTVGALVCPRNSRLHFLGSVT